MTENSRKRGLNRIAKEIARNLERNRAKKVVQPTTATVLGYDASIGKYRVEVAGKERYVTAITNGAIKTGQTVTLKGDMIDAMPRPLTPATVAPVVEEILPTGLVLDCNFTMLYSTTEQNIPSRQGQIAFMRRMWKYFGVRKIATMPTTDERLPFPIANNSNLVFQYANSESNLRVEQKPLTEAQTDFYMSSPFVLGFEYSESEIANLVAVAKKKGAYVGSSVINSELRRGFYRNLLAAMGFTENTDYTLIDVVGVGAASVPGHPLTAGQPFEMVGQSAGIKFLEPAGGRYVTLAQGTQSGNPSVTASTLIFFPLKA